jgi:GR25 family glycosyltransferase involved in LPS biosynthesis
MYQGRFINLDRSPDRRAAMEAQLRKWGLSDRYMRFAAIDGEDGQRACFRSHHAALEQADASSPVHVLEDDALLSGYVPQVIDIITSNEMLDHFDIVFTETLVAPDVMEIRELKQLFDKHRADETFMVRDITQTYYCGASSYLVGPKCRDRVLAAFRRGLDGRLPNDLFIRQEARAGNLKLGCVFPFVTTVQFDEETTTRGRPNDAAWFSKRAIDLLRYSFFVDRDFARPAKAIAAMRSTADPHRDLIEAVLGFVVSDQFVSF